MLIFVCVLLTISLVANIFQYGVCACQQNDVDIHEHDHLFDDTIQDWDSVWEMSKEAWWLNLSPAARDSYRQDMAYFERIEKTPLPVPILIREYLQGKENRRICDEKHAAVIANTIADGVINTKSTLPSATNHMFLQGTLSEDRKK